MIYNGYKSDTNRYIFDKNKQMMFERTMKKQIQSKWAGFFTF